MRCQEVLDQLSLLAYNELDDVSAARCEEHLAGCATCQAEWKSVQGAMRLLDLVPRQHTQVDLAAVCLRIARDQRHSRVVGRWAIGVAAAAALIVGMVAAQLLAINIEPGRLIVAWNAQPAPGLLDRGAAGDRVEAPIVGGMKEGAAQQAPGERELSTQDQTALVKQETQAAPPATNRDSIPSALALLLEGDRPLAWQRRRGALSIDDSDWNLAAEAWPAAGKNQDRASPERPTSYSDLRFKMIEDQQRPPTRKTPGA